jgi:chromosome segregation ATPase
MNVKSSINTKWFSIGSSLDENKNEEDEDYNIISTISTTSHEINESNEIIKELIKRIETCENHNKEIREDINNIKDSIKDIKKQLEDHLSNDNDDKEKINKKIKENETLCNVIRNENLKLINRILEAEISVERTTNILLRKNISFPFTKLNL